MIAAGPVVPFVVLLVVLLGCLLGVGWACALIEDKQIRARRARHLEQVRLAAQLDRVLHERGEGVDGPSSLKTGATAQDILK